MGLKLKNANEILAFWCEMVQDPALLGILIRHGEKLPDSVPRCGLSPRGEEQARLYGKTIRVPLRPLFADRDVGLYSSNTERNMRTLVLVLDLDKAVLDAVECPHELDLPFMGPNDEDQKAARELAKQHGLTVKEAYYQLEDHGIPRMGEHPRDAERRIRMYLEQQAGMGEETAFIYSLNSPVGNEAVGVEGSMAELEVAFLGWDNGHFTLLGRIAPEWEETAD